MDAFTKALLKGYVKSITFETNATDPITIREPFADSPPGISDAAIAALRPKLTVEMWDQTPLVIAPAGEPSKETRDTVKVAGIVAGVAIGGIALAILTRRKR